MDKKNNLLICTQVIDSKSSTLGFMHRWVEELSKVYNTIIVVCLFKGECKLPSNVKVISLGKEFNIKSDTVIKRIKHVLNFYKIIFSEIRNYNKVFVHMNQEYVLLGGLFWRIMRRKIFMWRNHYSGSFLTKIAGRLCEKVFFTSKFSFTAKFKNGVQMPVGVDIDSFKTTDKINKKKNSILFLARLDPSKKPDVVLKALKILKDKGVEFTATFVGGTSDKSIKFGQEMYNLKKDLGLHENVVFVGSVPSTETYKYYLSHDIYVNMSRSGMLDKTIFEALVAGCVPVTTSIDFQEMVGNEFKVEDSPEILASKLITVMGLSREDKELKVSAMQNLVLEKHGLNSLVNKIKLEV